MADREVSNIVQSALPTRLISTLLQLQWKAAVVPLSLLQYWLSAAATLVLRLFVLVGAPPREYRRNEKLREAMSTVDHLSHREEVFRKKIKELQDESEARLKDKRKALTKLHKARAELSDLQGGSKMESHGSLDLEVSPLPEDPSDWRVQLSFFAAAVLPVLWFWGQAETPAISRKVVSCILFPEVLMYVWKYFSRPTRAYDTSIHCGCWFLAGFIFCHWLLAQSA